MKPLNAQVFTFFTEMGYQHPQIQSIILFGSRARGDFSEKSDFDIAIFGNSIQKQHLKLQMLLRNGIFLIKLILFFSIKSKMKHLNKIF